ncbi:MAG: carboxypeptidase regulatory-like domain-containing protein, partial [Planctomycetes bacterium]|nr:carboxypeptidase regulatory-like domain-containing protein [Planctomycetota bacterium]
LELVGSTGSADRRIRELSPGAAIDVGAFVLGAPSGLCSGTIRDATGRPVADAHCFVERKHGLDTWFPELSSRTTSFADGSFRIPGDGEGEFRLLVHKTGYGRPLPIRITRPRHDLAIVMPPAARVIACVTERDATIPFIEFTLHRLDERGERVQEFHTRPDEDGYYDWRTIAPGAYDCVVTRFSSVLHEVRGVEVRAGKNVPPRLQNIAIRGVGGLVEVRLRTPDGTGASLIHGLEVHHVETGRRLEPSFAKDDANTLILSIDEPSKRIRLEAAGFAPVEVDCDLRRNEARLVPAN